MSRNKMGIAQLYITKSHYAYKVWGADAKVKDIEAKYFDKLMLRKGTKGSIVESLTTSYSSYSSGTTTTSGISSGLDFQSMLKASQAISGEIKIEKLLTTMMKILIENAGAEKGYIIQIQGDSLMIGAEGTVNDEEIKTMNKVALSESSGKMPMSVVRYVERTKEILVIPDAQKDKRFSHDSYVRENNLRSVLCAPIIHQNKTRAIIYLENNLATSVFTEQRVQILSVLSGQISISIDNAILYDNLEQKVEERTQQLNEKNQELDAKNRRITDSVRYARTIQSAILPLDTDFKKVFDDYFVLYKPKDIVSGDFYWFSNVDDQIFIAAVDCTGHGVPGAFMSMIGNAVLNQAVNEKGIYSPAEILKALHEGITLALKQNDTENSDGMDVCLCKIQYIDNKAKVTFSGAKRQLYTWTNNEFGELRGDRTAIGGVGRDLNKVFTNQEAFFEKGSALFLTTDGLADQPNFERERYGITRLKNILAQNAHLPMDTQKNILANDLQFHQGNEEQRDDITVIGIRL
jgi:serine phosphatase RsbU (regulator of sigma subunit)